jgi:hypothetical protein
MAAATVLVPAVSASQGGAIHLIKDCPPPDGLTCTVTVSDSNVIRVGTIITYSVLTDTTLQSTIHVPGGTATGFCDLTALFGGTGPGTCDFDGGTGRLKGLDMNVLVDTADGEIFTWDGSYHFDHGG